MSAGAAAGGLGKKLFLRSFLVQASWNFEGLQNLGFFFTIFPALAERYGTEPEKLRGAVGRHLGFFNTHPYFAGLVAAAIAREEGGEGPGEGFLDDLKQSLMSTLGSLGDSFFWATLRPFAALAALLAALLGISWAPLLLLFLFNVPHLGIRWWGVSRGLREGSRVIYSVQALSIPRSVRTLTPMIAVLAGLCAGAASVHPRWALLPGRDALSLAAGATLFLAGVLLASGRLSLRPGYAGLPPLVLLAALFWKGCGS